MNYFDFSKLVGVVIIIFVIIVVTNTYCSHENLNDDEDENELQDKVLNKTLRSALIIKYLNLNLVRMK